jgi:hypothetical protein
MFSKNESRDRILANRLNADLRNGRPELLSAQSATDRLRRQFSIDLAARLLLYAQEQRARYWPQGQPLTTQQNAIMEIFFSPDLLAAIRIVELGGQRLPNPPFYEEAKSIGLTNLPEITHMTSTTFVDVIVFNERATERSLFHGLVHAAQFKLLGVDKYCEAFIQEFRRRNSYFNVPLETQAISLEARFAGGHAGFSVEMDVSEWINSGRYVGA